MATLIAIDGKYYDADGHQVDAAGRRFLVKMPAVLARIAEMKAEALERAKAPKVFATPEERDEHRDESVLWSRVDSLREDINHINYNQNFLREIAQLHEFERRVNEVDRVIAKLKAYRERLVDNRKHREERFNTAQLQKMSKFHEIEQLQRELREIKRKKDERAAKRAGVTAASSRKPASNGKLAHAKAIYALMDPTVIEGYKAKGITEEQILAMLTGTLVSK